ncbi:MAG TPA: WD40 repeat domain-containing protein, partial [Thermoanaerobaculia bacterium]
VFMAFCKHVFQQKGPLKRSRMHLAVNAGGQWLLAADVNGDSHLYHFGSATGVSKINLEGEDWLEGNDPFSPDGRWLLTRSKGSSWRIRNLSQVSHLAMTSVKMDGCQAFAFSPDSRWLAAAAPRRIQIWDLNNAGLNPRSLQGETAGTIMTLAFSSDSQWLAEEVKNDERAWATAWKINNPDDIKFLSCHIEPEYLGEGFLAQLPDHLSNEDLSDRSLASHLVNLANCRLLQGNDNKKIGNNPGMRKITAVALADRGEGIAVGYANGEVWLRASSKSAPQEVADFPGGPIHALALQGNAVISQSGSEAPRVLNANPTQIEPARFYTGPSMALSPSGLALQYKHFGFELQGPLGSWRLVV